MGVSLLNFFDLKPLNTSKRALNTNPPFFWGHPVLKRVSPVCRQCATIPWKALRNSVKLQLFELDIIYNRKIIYKLVHCMHLMQISAPSEVVLLRIYLFLLIKL